MITIDQIKDKFKGATIIGIGKAQKNSEGKYVSCKEDEDLVLVSQKLNRVTIVDHDKWYCLYYLMEKPDTNDVYLISLTYGKILKGVDFEYYPNTVIEFCKENNIIIDEVSYIAICKSFIEYSNYDNDIIKKKMPKKCNVGYYIASDMNSICKAYHVHGFYDNSYCYAIYNKEDIINNEIFVPCDY